jgi:hypothetical protein
MGAEAHKAPEQSFGEQPADWINDLASKEKRIMFDKDGVMIGAVDSVAEAKRLAEEETEH